ncbi:MAG TPA: LuxR C-terminal-related transcriptional regulator [Methylomirabilota bacterium]|nr:LuxR C-terminal-related transcriptional regulator [Methylomirabilota bacterium]
MPRPRRDWTIVTDIEREVFRLRALGYRNKEIARKLYLSCQSVKNIISGSNRKRASGIYPCRAK